MHDDYQFGLRGSQLVHVDDVESGLGCECVCPYCKKAFVAHKGLKNRHHFKHYSTENCRYSHETALHYLAKEIISRKMLLRLPANLYFLPREVLAYTHQELPIAMPFFQEVRFDKIEVETWEGNFRPDLKCEIGGKVLYVEITVTSGIGYDKLNKFRALNAAVFEFNLAKFGRNITEQALEKALYDSPAGRWVNNPREQKVKSSFAGKIETVREFIKSNRQELKLYGKAKELYHCPLRDHCCPGKVPDKYEKGRFTASLFFVSLALLHNRTNDGQK